MIKYALQCEQEHPFEGWFSTSDDFEDQSAKGLIECPYCASKAVRKAIVAPAVAGTKAQSRTEPSPSPQMHQMMMQAMGLGPGHSRRDDRLAHGLGGARGAFDQGLGGLIVEIA